MEKVEFLKPIGNMKKAGEIYIRGLNGVPEYYKKEGDNENDWWWQEGTKKEEHCFLHNAVIENGILEKYINKLK